jgi:hypothetical protein
MARRFTAFIETLIQATLVDRMIEICSFSQSSFALERFPNMAPKVFPRILRIL